MNQITAADNKLFTITRLIASVLLVIAPFGYIRVAYRLVKPEFQIEETATLIMYLLIPIAALSPLVWQYIKRIQIRISKQQAKEVSLAKTYLMLMLNRLSLVAATFIYGLVAFFLTNVIWNMTWFYLIGIVWSIIYWPRRSHFEKVMNEGLEAI